MLEERSVERGTPQRRCFLSRFTNLRSGQHERLAQEVEQGYCLPLDLTYIATASNSAQEQQQGSQPERRLIQRCLKARNRGHGIHADQMRSSEALKCLVKHGLRKWR